MFNDANVKEFIKKTVRMSGFFLPGLISKKPGSSRAFCKWISGRLNGAGLIAGLL